MAAWRRYLLAEGGGTGNEKDDIGATPVHDAVCDHFPLKCYSSSPVCLLGNSARSRYRPLRGVPPPSLRSDVVPSGVTSQKKGPLQKLTLLSPFGPNTSQAELGSL